MEDYYRILGVPEDPGREAYEVLSDERSRRSYDERLATDRATVRVTPEKRNWFADEVAIDFPSIGAVVDRIREAFLAPEEFSRPLSAEILLTAREAFDGVVVPLDVPLRQMCPACGGRGEVWGERCGACGGTGEALAHHPVQLVVPPRVLDGARFLLSVSAPYAAPTRIEVRVAIR